MSTISFYVFFPSITQQTKREQGDTNTYLCHRVNLLTWMAAQTPFFPVKQISLSHIT